MEYQLNYNRKGITVISQLFQISVIFKSPFIVIVIKLELSISLHGGKFKNLHSASIIDNLKPCYLKCGCSFPTLPHQWHCHHLKLFRNLQSLPTQTY